MTKARAMRELLAQKELVVSPNVYDGYSAMLVAKMGFKAAATTGAGLSNARLGLPDIGLLSMKENVEACRMLAQLLPIPLMADAETGYGNAVSVFHAVRYFEDAGVVGLNLEDPVPDFAVLARGQGWTADGPIKSFGDLRAAIDAGIATVEAGGCHLIDVYVDE